jgi:hypothetical protein
MSPQMKELFVNGVLVGEVPATGDTATDVAVVQQFLKDRGLYREVTVVQAMFRQAASFADTAAMLYADLQKKPSRGLTIAPFVVNLTFSIELYLKTLAQAHGAKLTGHELASLFDELPPRAVEAVEAAAKGYGAGAGTLQTVRACLHDLKGGFVQWRYVYEHEQGPEVKVESSIWVAGVLHAACQASGKV